MAVLGAIHLSRCPGCHGCRHGFGRCRRQAGLLFPVIVATAKFCLLLLLLVLVVVLMFLLLLFLLFLLLLLWLFFFFFFLLLLLLFLFLLILLLLLRSGTPLQWIVSMDIIELVLDVTGLRAAKFDNRDGFEHSHGEAAGTALARAAVDGTARTIALRILVGTHSASGDDDKE